MSADKNKSSVRKIVLGFIFGTLMYGASYCLNSFLGGYWLKPEMDGRDRYDFGLAIPTAIMWQPLFGHEAIGHWDYLGVFYTPLIRLDRKFVHPTRYIFDDKRSNLEASQVHPHWRDEFVTEIAVVAVRDESEKVIRCTFRYTGSVHPRGITEIQMKRELAETLDVSPPNGFIEKSFEEYQIHRQKRYIRWVGELALPKDQEVILTIPAQQPKTGTGRITFQYQRSDNTSRDSMNVIGVELK